MAVAMSPGVYLEDVVIPRAPELRTGVPVFVGQLGASSVETAPFELDVPGWSARERDLGPAWAAGHLAFAVRGFFENGGIRCLVSPTNAGLAPGAALLGALTALEAIDGFDLVCAPGAATLDPAALAQAHAVILDFCARRGDCFAILDAPKSSSDVAAATASVNQYRTLLDPLIDAPTTLSSIDPEPLRISGAVYFPWVSARDAGGDGLVPPCGHVAGVYASSDKDIGVHKAPANVAMQGVSDLEVRFGADEQAALDPDGATYVNCIRALTGRGTRILGARTLARLPRWRWINVRRLVLTIGRFLDITMSRVVFEPNGVALWIRIGRELDAFLDRLYRRGALLGATANDAYFVKCDAETNPASVRDAGQVVTEIGLSPAGPSERIVVRLVHGAQGIAIAGTAGGGP